MPFVKLDAGILNSTTWADKPARDLFITALLMARPWQTKEPVPQLEVSSLNMTGWVVPPGRYGFVEAASTGLCRAALVDLEEGIEALHRLGAPDPESRTPTYEGRRLVRIEGGFIVMNFEKYREKDYKSAERSRRYRENQKKAREKQLGPEEDEPSRRDDTPSRRDAKLVDDAPSHPVLSSRERRDDMGELPNVTQAEAEAEAEAEILPVKLDPDLNRHGNRLGNARAPAREAAAPKGLQREKHPDEEFTDNVHPVELSAYLPSPWLRKAATDSGLDGLTVQRTLERYRLKSKLTVAPQSAHDKAFKRWLSQDNYGERPSSPPPAPGAPSKPNPGSKEYLDGLTPENAPEHFAGLARVAPWED